MTNVLKEWTGPDGSGVVLFCPGCNKRHPVRTAGEGMLWQWDGSFTHPTLSPSVDVHFEHFDFDRKPMRVVCHFFVRKGQIIYQGDCTHGLAGKTVPLPEVERWASLPETER